MEIYMLVPLILWLSANFVWMQGEVVNNDDDVVIPQASYMMVAAIVWTMVYYLVLKPLKLFPKDEYNNSR
jgi:hypothetical protein